MFDTIKEGIKTRINTMDSEIGQIYLKSIQWTVK